MLTANRALPFRYTQNLWMQTYYATQRIYKNSLLEFCLGGVKPVGPTKPYAFAGISDAQYDRDEIVRVYSNVEISLPLYRRSKKVCRWRFVYCVDDEFVSFQKKYKMRCGVCASREHDAPNHIWVLIPAIPLTDRVIDVIGENAMVSVSRRKNKRATKRASSVA